VHSGRNRGSDGEVDNQQSRGCRLRRKAWPCIIFREMDNWGGCLSGNSVGDGVGWEFKVGIFNSGHGVNH